MNFAEDSTSPLSIRSCDADGIVIDDRRIAESVMITPDRVESWPVADIGSLTDEQLDSLCAQAPEIVILGSGRTQRFPPARIVASLQNRGIGVEVMANDAACRTFNVLLSEQRRVVLGLVQN